MNSLINFIKGIFEFIGGLFGGKKSANGAVSSAKKGKGYFLELDEAQTSSTAPTPAADPAPAAPAAAQPTQTTTRKEKLAALAAQANAEAAPAAPAPAAPAPVAAKAAPTAPVATETAFATKYLVPANSGSRRRPGANMSSYLDMARKVTMAS